MNSLSIKELAKRMKVSPSTVSRALSGKPGVSEELREKISNQADKLGFRPDSAARNLRSGGVSNEVVILTGQGLAEISFRRNHVLFEEARKHFSSVRVMALGPGDIFEDYIREAACMRMKAVITTVSQQMELRKETVSLLKNRKTAIVTIDTTLKGFDSVRIDRAAGTYQAARMLLLSGCGKPVFYSSAPLENPDPRLMGVIKAFESLGRDVSDIQISSLDNFQGNGFIKGFLHTSNFLKANNADGLFCYNDDTAIGTLRALYKAGLKVPEDVKVIGFDNIPAADSMPVSLTTVGQPLEGPAKEAVKMALERCEDFDMPPRVKSFPCKLIVRESCPMPDNSLRDEIFKELK